MRDGLYPSAVAIRRVKVDYAAIAILVLAAALRLWALDMRPPHFDEGVNGWFADQMTANGYYRYDPTNYHGPLHFYAVFVSQSIFGRSLWALRLPAVLASVLAIWAVLRLREFFGAWIVRLAALAMAVSPAFTYYGRYSIHESWLVFFLLLILAGILGLWERGSRRDLWVLAAGVTGAVLTKETYAIHLGCFVLAFLVLRLWERVVPSRPPLPVTRQAWTHRDAAWAAVAMVAVIVAFYSGFFLDMGAVAGLWQTFAAWFQTGFDAGGHDKKAYAWGPLNFYWIALMARNEWAALAGLAACFWFVGRTDARMRYVAVYGGGALLAYSIIPYKTPWCALALLWPFYLTAAAASARLPRWVAGALWAVMIAHGLWASTWLNFVRYDHDGEDYAYVQTYRELNFATDPLLEKAGNDPRFYHERGEIILESYYPLPWILGDFTSVGYYEPGDFPQVLDSAFVLTSKENESAVAAALAGAYYRRDFRLRSGVDDCVAFFRHADFREIFGGPPDLIGTAAEANDGRLHGL
jgi:uncharacterized protein (TIGR03663 family)